VVRKGEKCIKILIPVMVGVGNATMLNIKPASVFDVRIIV